MQRLLRMRRRLMFFFRRDQMDQDLAEEVRLHLEMKAQEKREAGMSEKEAAGAAGDAPRPQCSIAIRTKTWVTMSWCPHPCSERFRNRKQEFRRDVQTGFELPVGAPKKYSVLQALRQGFKVEEAAGMPSRGVDPGDGYQRLA
jgi:hypothetical protein